MVKNISSEDEIFDVIPVKSKVAFGGASTASNILSGIGFAAMTFFYNVKLGLSAELIGIAWLLFGVWNAINDPVFGYIADKTKTRMGRRIPYLRFGAPVYTILFILCWTPFVDVNNEMALFIYFLLMLFFLDTIFTIVGLILSALPAAMAISSKERGSLIVYSTLIGAIGFIVSSSLPIFLLTGDASTGIDPSFLPIMIILGIICGIIIFISSYLIKENEYVQIEETLGLVDSIKETFKNKPFLILEAGGFTFYIASTILTTAVYYYVDYVLELDGAMAILPLLLVFIMMFAFTPVFSKLIAKYGLKKIVITGCITCGLSFILIFITGWTFTTAIFSLLLIGVGLSAISLSAQLIFADTVDYDETRTGKRREATYTGIQALITKPAISIANWLFLLMLSSFGFQKDLIIQSETAKMGIMIGFSVIPAISIFLGALILKFYTLHGPEWEAKKLELKKIHEEKEKNYLNYLKEQSKI